MLILRQRQRARGLSLRQMGQHPRRQRELGHRFLLARLGQRSRFLHALLDAVQIRKRQLQLDDLDVADGIDIAGHVNHVRVLEAADHHQDGAGLANVGQELVTQALALGRALHQPGDVDDLDDGRDHLLGRDVLGDPRHPGIGDRHDPHVGIDGAEGIVRRLRLARGQGIEHRALPDVGQPDDSN